MPDMHGIVGVNINNNPYCFAIAKRTINDIKQRTLT